MITVQFDDEDLPALKRLLNRALNTWDKAPKWAFELDNKVSKRLDAIKKRESEKFEDPKWTKTV
jgi:hypothetical protein